MDQDVDRTTDQTTGRWLVSLGSGRDGVRDRVEALRELGVTGVATSSDVLGPSSELDGDALLLERLGVAILRTPPERPFSTSSGPLRRIEPERRVHASALADSGTLSWGLQALGSGRAGSRGQGVSVAVLDTGVDRSHPDLAVTAATSLVVGEPVDDTNGHGTHCAGTVCGRGEGPAYGVAPGASLHVAKVLDASGSGGLGDVLAGIEWAVTQGCRVVSMSLSAAVAPGETWSELFEEVAVDLLDGPDSVHLVAAAGNDSTRSRGRLAPVGIPASCPSVVAVAAVGQDLDVADFSCAGPTLDVAGPGVDVLSAWPGGGRRVLSGTSMAAPHIAGVLALVLAAEPALTGTAVLERLRRLARDLPLPATDVGAGLVQRP